ncbi:MAG: ATP-binding protein [Deltaproteobacteria bacterium]|nr:ATP-binding protein [Deltaproteobacteria bacterium]
MGNLCFKERIFLSPCLDLQDRQDFNKLNEPELFLEMHRNTLVCLDEIQRLPNFFSVLRSDIDRKRHPGRFLILGSASRDMIRQSNETLAGRIAYVDLTPFLSFEVTRVDWRQHWIRGGFPNSLLSATDEDSFDWRMDFVRTFLERDIPSLGFFIPAPSMGRLWRLLAHYHGQPLNFHKLAESADLSVPTLKKYMSLLEQTYMIRILLPMEANLKKRLVKAPKMYLRDSGILHYLLDIETIDQLLSHGSNGASFEGYCIESILAAMPKWRPSYFRTSAGAEIDLVMQKGNECIVFEFKLSKAPKPSRGFHEIVKVLNPSACYVVAPVDAPFACNSTTTITPP